jgi:hypothetical protein
MDSKCWELENEVVVLVRVGRWSWFITGMFCLHLQNRWSALG